MDSSNHSACKEFPFFSFQLYWIPWRNISCTTSWNKLNAGRVFMDSLISLLFYVSFMARAAEKETAALSVYHFWEKRWIEDLKGCYFNIIQQLLCIIISCLFNGKYLTETVKTDEGLFHTQTHSIYSQQYILFFLDNHLATPYNQCSVEQSANHSAHWSCLIAANHQMNDKQCYQESQK